MSAFRGIGKKFRSKTREERKKDSKSKDRRQIFNKGKGTTVMAMAEMMGEIMVEIEMEMAMVVDKGITMEIIIIIMEEEKMMIMKVSSNRLEIMTRISGLLVKNAKIVYVSVQRKRYNY